MLPVVAAPTASWPSGVIGCGILHAVGTFLFGSALPRHRDFRSLRLHGPFGPRLAARVLWRLL